MVELGKRYTGNDHCFKGIIIPIDIVPDKNELRVQLDYQGSVWEETWELNVFNDGLSLGEYYELGPVDNQEKI